MTDIHKIKNKQNIKSLFASVLQTFLLADRQRELNIAYTDNVLQSNSQAINIGCLFVSFF